MNANEREKDQLIIIDFGAIGVHPEDEAPMMVNDFIFFAFFRVIRGLIAPSGFIVCT